MAEIPTVIDLLRALGFSYFFVPLLIAVLVFGILSKTKVVSDRIDVNAVIAFVTALIIGMYKPFVNYIEFLIPFLIVLIIFAFFLLMMVIFLGASMEDVTKAMKNPVIAILIVIVLLIIFYSSAVWVFPELWHPEYRQTYNATNATLPPPFMETMLVITNPTVLALIGFLVLVAVSAYAVTYKKT